MKYTKETIPEGLQFKTSANSSEIYTATKVKGDNCILKKLYDSSYNYPNYSLNTIVERLNSKNWVLAIQEDNYQIY